MQNPIAVMAAFLNPGKTLTQPRGDVQGSAFTSQRQGPGYAAAYAASGGFAASQAGVTTSAGLTTTYLGICLSNPAGSGVNLAIGRVTATMDVAPAALTFYGLITGFAAGGVTVHTTPLTVESTIIGGSAAALKGLADAACTLVGTPVWSDFLDQTPGTTSVAPAFVRDYGGSLLIPPGGYAAIGSSIAGPAAGFWGAIYWTENPQ